MKYLIFVHAFLIVLFPCLAMNRHNRKQLPSRATLRLRCAVVMARSTLHAGNHKDLAKLPDQLKNFVGLLIHTRCNFLDALCRSVAQPSVYSCDDTRDLLLSGVNPNAVDAHNKTPLMHAIDARSSERITMLLNHGALVDKPNSWQVTPIFYAIEKGYYSNMVLFLLKNGADVKQVRGGNKERNLTLLIQAIEKNNNKEVVEALLAYGANAQEPSDKLMPLTAASKRKTPAILNILLKHGVHVNDKHPTKNGTALHHAARSDSPYVAQTLLKYGAKLNARDYWRETPLMDAAREGSCSIITLLLLWGAQKDLENRWGQTALAIAQEEEHKQIIKLLS